MRKGAKPLLERSRMQVQYAHLGIPHYHVLQMLAYDFRDDQSRVFLAYVEVFAHHIEDIDRRVA